MFQEVYTLNIHLGFDKGIGRVLIDELTWKLQRPRN